MVAIKHTFSTTGDSMRPILLGLIILFFAGPLQARDAEDNYAVYGAGAEPCQLYLEAMRKGGKEQDYFIDWGVGYLSAFNVLMPETYNVLGKTGFPEAQRWLQTHCSKYPNELFINALIKLTGVLYPLRDQAKARSAPTIKDVSRSVNSPADK